MLGHTRLDNYIRTHWTGQLSNNIVDQTVALGQNGQVIKLGHSKREGYITAQQTGQSHYAQ